MSSDSDSNDDGRDGALGSTGRRSWDESFEALIAYKKKYGNVLVPSSYADDSALGHWVRKQRRNEANNNLSNARRDKLDSIGFAWKLRGDQATASEKPDPPQRKRNWMESYRALIAFKKKHGHCNVPRSNRGDDALGQWVNKQRVRDLTKRQREKLEAIGFDFEWKRDKKERSWEDNFERLKVYKNVHKDVNVPYHYPGDPGLGPWVSEQRRIFYQLSQRRIDKLESLGFHVSADGGSSEEPAKPSSPRESTASLEERWHQNYHHLEKFYRLHGNCVVSRNQDKPLSYWVVRQRQLNFQQKLKPDRKALLEKLNFEWYVGGIDRPEHFFDEMIGRLVEYQQEFGSVDVPSGYSRGGLGTWLESLKKDASEGKLAPERAERLLRTGFTWLEDRNTWLKTLEKVSQETRALRRNPTGVLEVPKTVENWLRIQFLLLEYDLLPPKRQARLTALGLTWNGKELSWVEYGPGEPMVGNAWLVDELASGYDLKDAALSWTPTAHTEPSMDHNRGPEESPPKSIVGDGESPTSSFDDAHPTTGTPTSPIDNINDNINSQDVSREEEEGTGHETTNTDRDALRMTDDGGDKRKNGSESGGSSPQYESALENEVEDEPPVKKPRVEANSL